MWPPSLTKLLAPGLVANGGSQMHALPVLLHAPRRADEHAQARLLEDVDVVVVGVAHGPVAHVLARLLALLAVDVLAVTVGPLLELLHCHVLLMTWNSMSVT